MLFLVSEVSKKKYKAKQVSRVNWWLTQCHAGYKTNQIIFPFYHSPKLLLLLWLETFNQISCKYSSLWNMPTKSNIQWRQKLNCFLISNRLECLTNSEPIHFCLQNMNLGTKYEIRSGVILHNLGQSKSGLLPYQWSWLVCNASVPHFSFSLFLFPLKKQTPQTVNDQLEWWICER